MDRRCCRCSADGPCDCPVRHPALRPAASIARGSARPCAGLQAHGPVNRPRCRHCPVQAGCPRRPSPNRRHRAHHRRPAGRPVPGPAADPDPAGLYRRAGPASCRSSSCRRAACSAGRAVPAGPDAAPPSGSGRPARRGCDRGGNPGPACMSCRAIAAACGSCRRVRSAPAPSRHRPAPAAPSAGFPASAATDRAAPAPHPCRRSATAAPYDRSCS